MEYDRVYFPVNKFTFNVLRGDMDMRRLNEFIFSVITIHNNQVLFPGPEEILRIA